MRPIVRDLSFASVIRAVSQTKVGRDFLPFAEAPSIGACQSTELGNNRCRDVRVAAADQADRPNRNIDRKDAGFNEGDQRPKTPHLDTPMGRRPHRRGRRRPSGGSAREPLPLIGRSTRPTNGESRGRPQENRHDKRSVCKDTDVDRVRLRRYCELAEFLDPARAVVHEARLVDIGTRVRRRPRRSRDAPSVGSRDQFSVERTPPGVRKISRKMGGRTFTAWLPWGISRRDWK